MKQQLFDLKAAAIWFFTNQALLMETLCTRFFTFPQNNIF